VTYSYSAPLRRLSLVLLRYLHRLRLLSHAAIVARYMGSAVAGCQHVTKKFKDVDIVRIDSSTGQGPCGQGWLAHCRLDAFNRSTIYVVRYRADSTK
jgi:hypothetical protein